MNLRVGLGFDVHAFVDDPARKLVLGGVVIDGARGLSGHSDADVIAHALADAVLSAAALGDIGAHFPAGDPRWKGADSIGLLVKAVEMAAKAGWRPLNGDCTVVAEAPSIGQHLGEMAGRLTSAMGAPVGVKAKRAEGLGTIGRAEGVACWAVVLFEEEA